MAAISYKELYNLVDKRLEKFEKTINTRFAKMDKSLSTHSKEIVELKTWRSTVVLKMSMLASAIGFIGSIVWGWIDKNILKNGG